MFLKHVLFLCYLIKVTDKGTLHITWVYAASIRLTQVHVGPE